MSYKGIKSMQGIEFFTTVTSLSCNGNQLTSLDVSKNTALTWLSCNGNQLASLDVSKNTALTWLSCHENQLASLDVSKNTSLTTLWCSDNRLTALDVSKNTALTLLYCYSNQLTSLDVSGCTALTSLYCYSNQIKGAAMDALVASLPAVSSGNMLVIYNQNEQNVMNTTQVAAAKAKGWTPRYYTGSEWQEYAGSEPVDLRGDVNGDGEVNVGDLVSVSNYMAGDVSVSKDAADVNQDGEVNVGDMVVISNIMSGNE